jgi:hypothetical protein
MAELGQGLDARGGFADPQPISAHIAFANNAQARGVPRHFVRALENAVLAADALVIEMPNDPVLGSFS